MILTRQILEDYAHLDKEIQMLEQKLDYYASKQLPTVHGVVQKSMTNYPYAESHLVVSGSDIKSEQEYQNKLRQKIVTLAEKKRYFDNLEIEIDDALEKLGETDLEMKQILEMKYMWGFNDEEIGKELNLERSTVTKKIKRFFKE